MFLPENAPLPRDAATPACADPKHLPLIDAAYTRPGGPQAAQMAEELCRTCPVARTCLDYAIVNDEQGTWGGTSQYRRTSARKAAERKAAARKAAAEEAGQA